MQSSFLLVLAVAVAGCASSSVTPISQNQFILNTSAAPACGTAGAQKVASKMAAVETLRRGYERYLIVGARNQNNTRVANMPRTGAYTTATVNTYGNTAYGTAQTNYYGGGPMVLGKHDAQLGVIMLRAGEPGYDNALIAKQELGPKWQQLVEKGVSTCN